MIAEIDPRLIEDAVRLAELRAEAAGRSAPAPADAPAGASAASGWVRAYHAERDALYAIGDPEARERGFRALHARWFAALGLDRPLRDALAREPGLDRALERVAIGGALRARDEGGELFVRGGAVERRPGAPAAERDAGGSPRRRLALRVRPDTLLDPARLDRLLARELRHTADMLDPAFGYEPRLPSAPGGQTHERLVLDRYAAAWSASVTGRLVREGRLDGGERAAARAGLARAFPGLDEALLDGLSARLLDGPRPSHAALALLARAPRSALARGLDAEPSTRGASEGAPPLAAIDGRCSLCAMPSATFVRPPADPRILARIREDAPAWTTADPVCPQCVDLYLGQSALAGR